jgi:exodeoxyribonuclease-5
LHSEAPALSREQQQQLFIKVCEDYPELRNKRDLFKAVKEDRHYGALQIKYAYAITCHKAQGGQWEDVYIDQGYITEDMLTEDYIRWLYTAITRATGHVYLVNWPEEQTEDAREEA